MLDDNFFNNMPDNDLEAVIYLCNNLLSYVERIVEGQQAPLDDDQYNDFLEFYSVLQAFIISRSLNFTLPEPDENKGYSVQIISQVVSEILEISRVSFSKNSVKTMTEKYLSRFNNEFSYEFSDGDISRIQALITDLRDFIVSHNGFEEKHRQRLLKRLEHLQAELHKKVSDLDKFWGLVGDAGVALGKFGIDAKPFVDAIKELAGIAWNAQSRAEELPSGTPTPFINNNAENLDDES